jgi:hypothetical protein
MSSTEKTNKYFIYHSEIPLIPSEFQFIDYRKTKKIKKAKEIFIFDLLDFVDNLQQQTVLDEIKKALDSDGVIYIQGTDAHGISSALLNNQIDLETYNNLAFASSRKHISNMGRIITLLKEAGFVIYEAKFVNGVQYSLKCGKPNE